MKTPRFSIRFLIGLVTLIAVGFGVGSRILIKRSVAIRETNGIKAGMTKIEVRWRLGAPHRTFDTPTIDTWGFDYEDKEDLPFDYFNVVFNRGRVEKVEQMSYISAPSWPPAQP